MSEKSAAILSVTQLTEVIKKRLESDQRLVNCYISGELSNFKHHSSGHMYFTLKDEKSRVRAIMFASRSRGLAFFPEDGMKVVCRGTIGVFERDGQYQIYVDDMQPDGVGALYVAFTQLRDKLAAEGLFHESRKRNLPAYPRRIGVVTSPTGAVIRDICSTLARRYPMAQVVLYPALVQGPQAASTIVRGIESLSRRHFDGGNPIDVIIVGRGGGSIEELWPFNEESVARAIAASPIPVISAVGHETDFTIADFVADVRAATPTAAAEMVAPHIRDIEATIYQFAQRSKTGLEWRLSEQKGRLTNVLSSHTLRDPLRLLDRPRQNIDFVEGQLRQFVARPIHIAERRVAVLSERLLRIDIQKRLQSTRTRLERLQSFGAERMRRKLSSAETGLERSITALEALNPLRVLSRGYSVVYKEDESTVVSSSHDVRPGDVLRIRFADDTISAKVTGKEDTKHVGEQSRLNI